MQISRAYDAYSVANIPRGVLGTRVNQSESGYVSDKCRIRVDGQIRFAYGYGVDVEIFESGKKKLRFKYIRILVDGASF